MSVKPIGIGVIGLGNAAKPHALALKDLMGSELVVTGVFCREGMRRQSFAEKHGFPMAASYEALIDNPATDMILLLTPPNARQEIVSCAIAAGKAILMEKPIERTSAAAEELVIKAEAAKIPFGIVFQHRLRPAAEAMRQLLGEGRLGTIGMVRLIVPWWREQAYYDEPGRGTLMRDGGGVLISQAIHPLDLMLDLLGPVTEVQSFVGTTTLHRMETEDFATAGLRFKSGALGAVIATTAAFPGEPETLSVDGSLGSAEMQSGELVVTWRTGIVERFGSPAATGSGADPMAFDHGAHRAVITDFIASIAAMRAPAITARSALAVHHLIDAMLLSSREGRRVTMPSASTRG